jgi:hypothetical protein
MIKSAGMEIRIASSDARKEAAPMGTVPTSRVLNQDPRAIIVRPPRIGQMVKSAGRRAISKASRAGRSSERRTEEDACLRPRFTDGCMTELDRKSCAAVARPFVPALGEARASTM